MPSAQHSGYRTATGAGAAVDFGAGNTFINWVLVPTSYANDTVFQMEVSPDNVTWTPIGRTLGGRPVSVLGSHINARYGRVNVITLGTGTPAAGIGAVLAPS